MSEEIKPVAYRFKNEGIMRYGTDDKYPLGKWDIVEPLYTKQQLQPRVKMTREQAGDFKDLHEQYSLLSNALNSIYEVKHSPMKLWITKGKPRQNEMMFAKLWAGFNALHPEETIEIIVENKWFVRSINDPYLFLLKDSDSHDTYGYFDDDDDLSEAKQFDTKEQAEEWTNPLTEAVLLPVGDE
ncbi:hypothetical protein [Leuconostoc gasicomitatum]|uniref:hypothetical protein n=1 Tax=Leuconostoc gasicomitatum TaxID=115778 RepID=UPI001CC3A241|nr:hypothetical protein [Leuconostoc gasicomitatum]MBZ5958159.1 hypothetical protein [Leuconostoc gasicomitatum]